jgi:predicted dehydrogenase
MLRVGVIGCGYWGPNLVRNFAHHPRSRVHAVCDMRFERAARVAREYDVSEVTDSTDELLTMRDVDFVVIAVPCFTHYALAKKAIEAGKHVLLMKPMTTRSDHAEELCELAERQGVLLAVDHTFLFTGAVRKMKSLIEAGEVGELYYFDSVRINLGLFQSDVNVIWDLAPHDVSIMDYLIDEDPISVSATGVSHGGSPTQNIAYLNIWFTHSLLGHVHVNWLAPAKIRRTIVGGSKRMLVYDDMEPSEKLKVYDKGFSMHGPNAENDYQLLYSYRTGDMHAPKLDTAEALTVEVENVVAAVNGEESLMVDGAAGVRVVRILEAAQRSLENGGVIVSLNSTGAVRDAPRPSESPARA